MLGQLVRSGRVEVIHTGSVAVVDAGGTLLASHGDIKRAYFIRSAAKPFQVRTMQKFGAELHDAQLAVAGSSHSAMPQHVALIEEMLAQDGLSEDDLKTPVEWPNNLPARDKYVREGAVAPRKIWYNCSGKHAGLLRACVASDLPTETYLDPAHRLQIAVTADLREALGENLGDVGVDGCGAPAVPTSTKALATAFAKLSSDPDMGEIYSAYQQYPVLIGDVGRVDGRLNAHVGTAAKIGADGCLGVGFKDLGIGVGVKVDDGNERGLAPAMVGVLRYLGLLTPELENLLLPPVMGGGERVGYTESTLQL